MEDYEYQQIHHNLLVQARALSSSFSFICVLFFLFWLCSSSLEKCEEELSQVDPFYCIKEQKVKVPRITVSASI